MVWEINVTIWTVATMIRTSLSEWLGTIKRKKINGKHYNGKTIRHDFWRFITCWRNISRKNKKMSRSSIQWILQLQCDLIILHVIIWFDAVMCYNVNHSMACNALLYCPQLSYLIIMYWVTKRIKQFEWITCQTLIGMQYPRIQSYHSLRLESLDALNTCDQ